MSSTYQNILQKKRYKVPTEWLKIHTIDMHTGGEPLRVIVDGFPLLEGNSVLERRQYVKTHFDHLRKALMFEPRGHADMYGCLLIPPNDPSADFGILFLHNEGYSTMCGHAVIAISKLAFEMNWVERVYPITQIEIDAPCGRITAFVENKDSKVTAVSFHCVPSFVVGLDLQVAVPEIGTINYDLAYGGAFYAYVNAKQINLSLEPNNYSKIIEAGRAIKQAVILSEQAIVHPFEEDLSFLYGTIFIDKSMTEGVDSRNVCVFADGEVDRCPTGSGVSGRMAIHFKRQDLQLGELMTIESITQSVFQGKVVETCSFGSYEAVIPEVAGNAFITGQHEFLVDPDDPFKTGFFLR